MTTRKKYIKELKLNAIALVVEQEYNQAEDTGQATRNGT